MEIIVERDIPVPMRDGVRLATDLYRPAGQARLPSLLHRTPYGKREQVAGTSLDGLRLARAGFNLVVQDVRGRFTSEGLFRPYVHESLDGADTVEWIQAQPWSRPAVGMLGRSYAGAAQWLAAVAEPVPQHLLAFAPAMSSADFYDGWTYRSGALQLDFCLPWVLEDLATARPGVAVGRLDEERRHAVADMAGVYREPAAILDLLDHLAPYYREWLEHPDFDQYWRGISARESFARIAVPALIVGGWYDVFLPGTLADFTNIRQMGATRASREQSRLIIGPWDHRPGAPDGFDLTGLHEAWFSTHLSDVPPVAAAPRVQLFVMGADEWRTCEDWPPPGAHDVRFYLRSLGRANTAAGDGRLTRETSHGEPEDSYVYDPSNPVRGSLDEVEWGEHDQQAVERREDVLCYTTAPLEEPLTVVGNVTLVLHASASTVDTDFAATLVDVAPDGMTRLICHGILRARYRDSLAEARALQSGRIYRFTISVGATANVFGRHHRIRLHVTSSRVPQFDPNANTGGPSVALVPQNGTPARITVYHRVGLASHLVLPTLLWSE